MRSRRRMGRGVVERVEVVVDGLDLGTLQDGEAETDEDVLDLAQGGGDQVQAAHGLGRIAGQRDVDAVAGELRVQLAAAEGAARALDERVQRVAHLVGALADRTALAGSS